MLNSKKARTNPETAKGIVVLKSPSTLRCDIEDGKPINLSFSSSFLFLSFFLHSFIFSSSHSFIFSSSHPFIFSSSPPLCSQHCAHSSPQHHLRGHTGGEEEEKEEEKEEEGGEGRGEGRGRG